MSTLDSNSAIAAANAEVAEMVGSIGARRRYTVSKFGMHPDGYPHARVVVDGKPFYFHCQFGSWQAPGRSGKLDVHKEPEALLGSTLGREVKYTLAEKARAFRRARQEESNDRSTPPPSEDAEVDGPPVRQAGLPDGRHRQDAPDEVQPD